MKKHLHSLNLSWLRKSCYLFVSLLCIQIAGCVKHDIHFPLHRYQQVNLVSDVDEYNAMKIDKNLANAWGIAVSPTGIVWISANHTGVSTIYDKDGNTVLAPVLIPAHEWHNIGSPTGQVFNGTSGFVIPSTNAISRFIFASEDGVISAWAPGSTAAVIVKDRNAEEAVYKGITMANDGTGNFLYVANFKGGKIEVFDSTFHRVTNKPFRDPSIPAGFAPFNIKNIDGKLYVLYAKQKGPDNEDDEPGVGNGYVNIFTPDGSLIGRFASKGPLNSPWGIVKDKNGFCSLRDAILIGNFGDGRINVYDQFGIFQGQLQGGGQTIAIDGLWALENQITGADPSRLYFTAGPDDEQHGLFGYLERK